jgi:nucleotide-binding universal stress UspA family protein
MLRVPPSVPAEAAKARRALDAVGVILVPIIGRPYSLKAVELACRLGEIQKAEILVATFLEMPLSLPLGAPSPQAEGDAQSLLDQAEAVVKHHDLPCRTKAQRAREAAEGILALAREENADLIVMGVTPKAVGARSALGRTAETLLRRAGCEVILEKTVA